MKEYAKLLLSFLLLMTSCRQSSPYTDYTANKELVGQKAVVVSAHPIASEIGINILKQGGNAIDAAIAVHFALAVTLPAAGNIGGGGFLVYREANGSVYTLDFREKAPALATERMYQDSLGQVIEGLSTFGHLSVGVPGSVDGMQAMFNKFSKLKNWKALVEPARKVAEMGFAITSKEADGLNDNRDAFMKANGRFTPFHKENGWIKGDLLVQKDLSNTLSHIRDKGRAGFYEGPVADALVAEMQRHKGLITHEDLQNYHSVWREPITFTYKEYTIHSMPPPSSGGIALQQLMQSVAPYPLADYGIHSSAAVHLMVEAERRAYADRATHLGDPDYYMVPQLNLLDSTYIAQRMQDFNPNKAGISTDIEAGIFESEQTTHFSIIDAEGNAVSLTTTLNTGYGSKTVVEGGGYLLNNEMDDFSSKPGVPNYFGLIGAEANKIEPGKRMLSSMTPTILEKDGQLFMSVGTPGGSTIITSVFQTVLNVIEFGQSAAQAVSSPRFHHQWLPDQIQLEDNCLSSAVKKELEAMGHQLHTRGTIGRVEAIVVRSNGLEAGADPRGDDSASGY